jgi:glycosyltransferase involved in cell wall biosynthesis
MPVPAPRVSVLVAVWNGEPYLLDALESIYRQTLSDFELVVVDDGSDDATPELLRLQLDTRLRVVRTDRRRGVAGALNLGLDAVGGTIVARMDADDIAEPDWLARLVARLDAHPRVGIAGAGLIEMPGPGKRGVVHLMPPGVALTRWRALFGTPFFHNAVAFERSVLHEQGLRYDPALEGAEDFDLWTRVLRHVDGDNVPRALVRYRTHTGQTTWVDGGRHETLRREIALREIRAVLPSLGEEGADLAWRAADARPVPVGRAAEAAGALADLLAAFERDVIGRPDRAVRADAARAVARLAVRHRSPSLVLASAGLDPLLRGQSPTDGCSAAVRRRASVARSVRSVRPVRLRPRATQSARGPCA